MPLLRKLIGRTPSCAAAWGQLTSSAMRRSTPLWRRAESWDSSRLWTCAGAGRATSLEADVSLAVVFTPCGGCSAAASPRRQPAPAANLRPEWNATPALLNRRRSAIISSASVADAGRCFGRTCPCRAEKKPSRAVGESDASKDVPPRDGGKSCGPVRAMRRVTRPTAAPSLFRAASK